MNPLRLLSLLGLVTALACGDRDAALDEPITLLADTVALDDRLVLIDGANDRALLFDVKSPELSATPLAVALPHNPERAYRRSGKHNEALILSMGRRATVEEEAQDAALSAIDGDGKLRRYGLGGSPFDSIKQSEDGRYAFLFKDQGSERLLENLNEVAIVDLSKSGGEIKVRTLRSFGDSPSQVVFSPTMQIVGEDRRLAVVLSDTNVTLIDLNHLDRRETTVQLSSGGGQSVLPTQVMFNPEEPELYVRGESSSDIFVFNLAIRAPDEDESNDEVPHNDFRPFIDQLGVGGRPSDMALYSTDSGTRLLVLAVDTQEAAVVEAATSQVTSVELDVPATSILLFEAASPRDNESTERALLYEIGGSHVMFLDLQDLEDRGSRNLEVLSLSGSIQKLVPILEEKRVLIIHADGQGVSLIDLAARTVSPITTGVPLSDALFDASRGRLWVGPSNQPYVGWLDLDTGDADEVLLDAPIQTFVPMFSAGKLAILHDSDVGYLTVLDATTPARDTAQSVRGFYLSGLFD